MRSLLLVAVSLASLVACSGNSSSDPFIPSDGGGGGLVLGHSDAGKSDESDAGIDATTTAPPKAPAATCGYGNLPLDPTNACDACDIGACCAVIEACDSDATCVSLVQCLFACKGDQTCNTTCTQTYAEAVPTIQSFSSCQKKSCAAQCK